MSSRPFDYLPLLLARTGAAKLRGGGAENATTRDNRTVNRASHSAALEGNRQRIADDWSRFKQDRANAGAPPFDSGIPLLLKVDPGIDLDELQHQFGFEIVSEELEGFLIVATEDTNLSLLESKIRDFAAAVSGTASGAKIHELKEDPTQAERLKRILSDSLLADWGTMSDEDIYICDLSVSCLGLAEIPSRPGTPKRGRLKDEAWARKQAAHALKLEEWSRLRAEAYESWDELKFQRSRAITRLVNFYRGAVLGEFDGGDASSVDLPDSFTLRIEVSAQGLKDIVLNDPHIFEVAEPEDIETPQQIRRDLTELSTLRELQRPSPGAPRVCVIDSGIQEEHQLLEPVVDKEASRCFLPGTTSADVGDYVANGGHGTRVAGCLVYGHEVGSRDRLSPICWIQNARVLNDRGEMPKALMPAQVLRDIVSHYHLRMSTRIFNQSINVRVPCQLKHMSAWAAEIDHLSHEHDILIIQSAGNIPDNSPFAPRLGVKQLLDSGKNYPQYLQEAVCRIANPSQSLQAITVGSVAGDFFENDDWRSIAPIAGKPSAFSRTGLGIWDTIKPEVVEFGGDYLLNKTTGEVSFPPAEGRVYPELVRSTMTGGPGFSRDMVGTSFSTPIVARIAAELQRVLPSSSCLLYRALIIQSAKWPRWARDLSPEDQSNLLKHIGFGIPDLDRATSNTEHRVTYITREDGAISPGDCHVYQVRIPNELRSPGSNFDVRIDVTLSYSASPRRTRRRLRGYLSTWLEWTTNRQGESIEAFARRVIKNDEETTPEGERQFKWVIHEMPQYGLANVKRASGTVQKDWAVAKSNALPESFCIAVRGHKGWSTDPESQANYALAVTFEVEGQEMAIYSPLEVSTSQLLAELEGEIESEIEVEVNEEFQ